MKLVMFKKLIFFVTVLSTAFCFYGCDDNDDEGTENPVCPPGRIFIPSRIAAADRSIEYSFEYENDRRLKSVSGKSEDVPRHTLLTLTYDEQKRVKTYSNEIEKSETTFTYHQDTVFGQTVYPAVEGAGEQVYNYYYILNDRNAIVKEVNVEKTDSTLFEYDAQGRLTGTVERYSTQQNRTSLSYGNGRSMTHSISMEPWLRYILGKGMGISFYFWSMGNGLSEVVYEANDMVVEREDFTYVYNECELPSQIRSRYTEQEETTDTRLNIEYYGVTEQ